MTPKLTPTQTEAFYGAYKAHRDNQYWSTYTIRRPTLKILAIQGLIISQYPQRISIEKGLPLAIELSFPARYDAEKQAAAAKAVSDEAQQAEYRKLLGIPDTIAAPRIMDSERYGIHFWTVLFSTGIRLWGRVNLEDVLSYWIDLDNIRLESTADITTFQREMYAANNLFMKLQRDLRGEPKPYEPSALAMLPGKGIGERP